jgi:hypothetical protein
MQSQGGVTAVLNRVSLYSPKDVSTVLALVPIIGIPRNLQSAIGTKIFFIDALKVGRSFSHFFKFA